MAEILWGSHVAEALNAGVAKSVAELKQRGISPILVIVRIGEKLDDIAYERGAVKRCEKVGVGVRRMLLPADTRQSALVEKLYELNNDKSVHGILVLQPLPMGMDDDFVRNAIAPEKDVDGITDGSLAGVFTANGKGYPPCTAQACMEILDYYKIDCAGKHAVVVGRSLVVGKPAAVMLIGRNATTTVCHTKTKDIAAICRKADILIISAGRARIAGKEFFSAGQTVIDVGINIDNGGKLCGDADFDEASRIVRAITPVPGGVGTVTTSVLAKHVVMAANTISGQKYK